MSRTAIYARKSTESDDRQVLSLDAQLHWANETCARLGVGNPLVFTEARSAKTPGREAFGRLMRAVTAGQIDTIVCWKADRLARNAADAGTVLFALESKHLRRIVTADGTYADDADSELMLGILLGFSAKYSKDLSKNIRRGMEEKLRRGEWSWTAPVGYKNVRLAGDRAIIAVDELTAPYVRQLFELAATGDYSLNDLVRITRHVWKLQKPIRRSNSTRLGLSHTTIDHILRNPFYKGLLVVKGEVYAASHPPLVSQELFDAVQRARTQRGNTARRPSRRELLFAGLLRCPLCGRVLVGSITKSKSGKPYTYYACTNRIRRRCAQARLSEERMLQDITTALRPVTISNSEYALAERMLSDYCERSRQAGIENASRVEAELRVLEGQRSRLLELLLANAITQEDYDRKRHELASRSAEASLGGQSLSLSLSERLQTARTYVQSLVEADAAFAILPAAKQRIFLRGLGLQIVGDGRISHLDLKQPASLIAERHQLQESWSVWEEVAKFFLGDVDAEGTSSPQQEAA